MSVLAALQSIEAKNKQKDELMLQLKRSLAIQELWSEAFDCGAVSTYWTGNIYHPLKWVIKRPDGESRIFTEKEVPKEIYLTMPPERLTLLEQKRKFQQIHRNNA